MNQLERLLRYFSQGLIGQALFRLCLNLPKNLPNMIVVSRYEDDSAGFKRDMRRLAYWLERYDL